MTRPEVFVFAVPDEFGDTGATFERAGCALAWGDESWLHPGCVYEDDMAARAAAASAMTGTSVRNAPVTRRVLEGAQRLRIVAKCTVGTDDVDVDAASELGILVTHAPTLSNWGGVAEGAMAMMLAILKKSREKDALVKAGVWRHESMIGTYLGQRGEDGYPGIAVGIVGFGRIGKRMAELLAPWHVRLLACDPYVDDGEFARRGVEKTDMATLLAESDVVTLHATLTRETRGFFGTAEFAAMKPTATFMNTARGGLVDQGALADALEAGEIAAAAIDAYVDEPLAADSRLRGFGDRVLLSAHNISHNRGGGLGPGVEWAARSVLAALRGEVPDHVFNPECIPRWRDRFGGSALIG